MSKKMKYLVNICPEQYIEYLENGNIREFLHALSNFNYRYFAHKLETVVNEGDCKDDITLQQFESIYFGNTDFNNFILLEIESEVDDIRSYSNSNIIECKVLDKFNIKSFKELDDMIDNNGIKLIINNAVLLLSIDQGVLNHKNCTFNCSYTTAEVDNISMAIFPFINAMYNEKILNLSTAMARGTLANIPDYLKLEALNKFRLLLKDPKNEYLLKKLLNTSTISGRHLSICELKNFFSQLIYFDSFYEFMNSINKCKTQVFLSNLSRFIYSTYDDIRRYINDDNKFEEILKRVILILEKNNIYNNLENLAHILFKRPDMIKYCKVDINVLIYEIDYLNMTEDYENLLSYLKVDRAPEHVRCYANTILDGNINSSFTFIQFAKSDDVIPYLNIFALKFIKVLGPSRGHLIENLIPFYKTERIELFMKSLFNILESNDKRKIKNVLKYLKTNQYLSKFVSTVNMENLHKVSSVYIDDIII